MVSKKCAAEKKDIVETSSRLEQGQFKLKKEKKCFTPAPAQRRSLHQGEEKSDFVRTDVKHRRA